MKIAEIIQRVQSLYSKGAKSDDSRLTNRHIYNKLITVRTRLISEKAKKKQIINQWNYQVLPCVELIKAPVHECPCIPPIGCQFLRTKYKLPKPLSNYDNHLIQSVTTLDGNTVFSEITFVEKKYKLANKYTAKKPDYYIKDDYIYITATSSLKVITIIGLFEDPIKVAKFPSFCNEDCKDCDDCKDIMEEEFPIDDDMIDILVQLTIQELVILFSSMNDDRNNDSVDNARISSGTPQGNQTQQTDE